MEEVKLVRGLITIEEATKALNMLQELNFIKILNSQGEVLLRPKMKNTTTDNVELWIDEYRQLFKGKKSGAMGDRNTCIKNMRKFMSEHNYTKDFILKVTLKYINDQMRDNNCKYLMQADYFIYKNQDFTRVNTRSKLATCCEEFKDGEEEQKQFGYDI